MAPCVSAIVYLENWLRTVAAEEERSESCRWKNACWTPQVMGLGSKHKEEARSVTVW